MSTLYDEHRNYLIAPREHGRRAFWAGKPVWCNPFIQQQAEEWYAGWQRAAERFKALGGGTDQDRDRLRPADVPRVSAFRRMSRRGRARKGSRHTFAAQKG